MDALSGEILALASLPDFHPDQRATLNDEAKFNRATLGVYELGSVFKTVTYATALETTPRHLWPSLFASEYSTAPLRVSRFTITDYRPKLARLNFAQGLVHSSNVTTAQVMRAMGGGEALRAGHERLGLHEPLALGISEVGAPRPPARWGKTESVTASYGHGFAVTPVHLLRAFSAIVNGGQLPEPTLLKRQARPRRGSRSFRPRPPRSCAGLCGSSFSRGAAGRPTWRVISSAGKTGTANQILRRRSL